MSFAGAITERCTRFITEEQVKELLTPEDALQAVAAVFLEKARGGVVMPVKLNVELPGGDVRAMPAYLPEMDIAGVKVANSHPENPKRGLSTVMAVIEANHLTGLRTGAASALATKWLARPESETLAVIGACMQARYQIDALLRVRPGLKTVKIWSLDKDLCHSLFADLGEAFGISIMIASNPRDAVFELMYS